MRILVLSNTKSQTYFLFMYLRQNLYIHDMQIVVVSFVEIG